MIYLRLFFEFFKIGLFAIGGGLATFPFLESLSEKTGWFSISQLIDMIAVSEATPGPIGVNMSTYCGYIVGGIPGAVTATIGLIVPSVIIIILLSKILEKYMKNFYVEAAFYGLRPAVIGLIAAAGFSVFEVTIFRFSKLFEGASFTEIIDIKATAIFAVVFVLIKKFKVNPIICIIGSAVVGIFLYGML